MQRTLLFTLSLCCLMASQTFAQGVGINGSGASPDASAGLDVDFSDRGILIPRLTQAQRDAISAPAEGLQVYNTDTKCFNFYNGSSWLQSCYDCDFPVPTIGSNSPACEGTALNLTATTVSGATYSWTGPNGFSSSDQNPTIANVTTQAGGIYFLTVTYNGCSIDAGNTSVTVIATPSVSASSNSPVCPGSTINLSATAIGGATYSWTGPNAFTSTSQNPSITNATNAEAGVYSVEATLSGCTGPASNTTVSLQNPTPVTPGAISGSTSGVAGASGNYSISSVTNATSYTWTAPAGSTVISGQGTTSATITFGVSGGNVCVTADNACGSSAPQCIAVTLCSTSWLTNSTGYTQNNTTYASSNLSISSYPPTKTVDGLTGNNTGRWVSAQNAGMPQWIAYNLGSSYVVDEFRLWNLQDDHAEQGVKDFKLQTANSISGPWTDVLTGTAVNQSTSWQTYTLPSAAASQYWRVYVTSTHDPTYGWVQLMEVGWKGCQ